MENTNFSLGIKRVPFSRMLKSEMADFVEKTIGIVEIHDLESELIAPMYELLKAKESDIKLLRLSYGIDTMRLRVNKLKGEMMLVISTFKLKVRLLSKSNPELDMHVIQNAINKHLRYLDKCRNDKELSQKIAGFFDMFATNGELQTAMEELNLTAEVDNMQAIYNQVKAVGQKRVQLLSLRPNVSTKAIVKGMAVAIDNLFRGIEVANMLSTITVLDGEEPVDTIDFVPLIDELDQLSEMYSRSISIRNANNKRKANKEKEGEEGGDEGEGEDEGGEDAGEPMTTAMCFGNDEGADEGDDEGDGDTDEDSGVQTPY